MSCHTILFSLYYYDDELLYVGIARFNDFFTYSNKSNENWILKIILTKTVLLTIIIAVMKLRTCLAFIIIVTIFSYHLPHQQPSPPCWHTTYPCMLYRFSWFPHFYRQCHKTSTKSNVVPKLFCIALIFSELFRRMNSVILFVWTWHSGKRILCINIFFLQLANQYTTFISIAVSEKDKNKIKLKGLFIRLK